MITFLMIMQGVLVTMGEEMDLTGEFAVEAGESLGEISLPAEEDSVITESEPEFVGEMILSEEEEELSEEVLLDDSDALISEEGTEIQEEEIQESALEDESLSEDTADVENLEEEIQESVPAEELFPSETEEEEEAEDELTSDESEISDETNPKIQAADRFRNAAAAILAGVAPVSEPEMVGVNQLTKNYVSDLLKDYLTKHGKKDSDGDYYITATETVNGVKVTANIYYVVSFNEFFFEMKSDDVIEGTSYVSTVWMDVAYAAASSADVSYFLDQKNTDENYVAAYTEIPTPAKYTGTEKLTFTVEGLDQDLLDYEVQDLSNASLKAAFVIWNKMLLQQAKVSIVTFGFDSYKMAAGTHSHSYQEKVIKQATETADGKVQTICKGCSFIKTDAVIKKASNIRLNFNKFIYNGAVLKPTVTIKDSDGKVIDSKNYTVTYSNASSTKVGNYTVTVNFKNYYTGSKTLSYSILSQSSAKLATPKLLAVYNSAKGLGVQFINVSGAKEYVIYRKFKGEWSAIKTVSVTSAELESNGQKRLYIDTTVRDNYGNGYIYSVVAKSGSDVSAFDPKGVAIYRLAPPTLKGVKSGTNAVKLNWTKAPALGYEVSYRPSTQSDWIKCKTTSDLTQTVTGLKKGVKYIFRIRCYKTNADRGTYYSYYSPWVTVQL